MSPATRRPAARGSGRRAQSDSFLVRMIRDFFLVLVAVICLELLIRFAVVWYEFEHQGRHETQAAAERLASDLKDIMLNRGGPVAARTIYPTWERTHRDLGLEIAIVPSGVTFSSIQSAFGFEPRGLVARWPDGRHHEARATLSAEPFCISCHVDAKPGDALGYVAVRSYLRVQVQQWVKEARWASFAGMANIIVHTIVLFLLLKARMEPLLALRTTISELARGRIDLSHRARVISSDEFGQLAHDLNCFLERMSHIIEDLDRVLAKIVAINHRLSQVTTQFDGLLKNVRSQTHHAMGVTLDLWNSRNGPFKRGLDAVEAVVTGLDELQRSGVRSPLPAGAAAEPARALRVNMQRIEGALDRFDDLSRALLALSGDLHDFSHFLHELALLEERMAVIGEAGQHLLDRVSVTSVAAGARPPAVWSTAAAGVHRPPAARGASGAQGSKLRESSET